MVPIRLSRSRLAGCTTTTRKSATVRRDFPRCRGRTCFLTCSFSPALPPRCAAGGIDSFSPSSSRTSLQCSACLPGSYLVKGACLDSCPPGSMVSGDSKSCQGKPMQVRTITKWGTLTSAVQPAIRLARLALISLPTARRVRPLRPSSSTGRARPLLRVPPASLRRRPLSRRPTMPHRASRATQTARPAPARLRTRACPARPIDPS